MLYTLEEGDCPATGFCCWCCCCAARGCSCCRAGVSGCGTCSYTQQTDQLISAFHTERATVAGAESLRSAEVCKELSYHILESQRQVPA